jgi:ABC-type dipeptide/oligopeptide/nickel transport system permease component
VLSWLVGIPVAIISALKPNTVADSVVRFISILFIAVPGFWVGMLIVLALLFWFGYRAPMAGVGFFHRSDRQPAARHRARRSCWGWARPPISPAWVARACSK